MHHKTQDIETPDKLQRETFGYFLHETNLSNKPYSARVLALAGLLLAGMGLHFIFIRPPLLPKNLRYMIPSLQNGNDSYTKNGKWIAKDFLMKKRLAAEYMFG